MIELDGDSLTPQVLVDIGCKRPLLTVTIAENAWNRMDASRKVVENVLRRNQVKYGINTGFGKFSDVIIPPDKLALLQTNLIRSHAVGVGPPLSISQTRML